MKILFLTHSFNSLAQRLFVELKKHGHEMSIEFDINDSVSVKATELFQPDIIVAPFLKRAIPETIWKNYICLVVHPGIKGDRGPSALDWAIMNSESEWGITVLQANAEMDGGDIWATRTFPLRKASKSSIYRNEVTEAAVTAILESLEKFEQGDFVPAPLDYNKNEIRGQFHPLMKQSDRAIDWKNDTAQRIVQKIRSGDGVPGTLGTIAGLVCYLYNACEDLTMQGTPGKIIAHRNGAICVAAINGGVWITHMRIDSGERGFKLPATMVLGDRLQGIPEFPEPTEYGVSIDSFQGISYQETDGVGYLAFNFYNGAMNTHQCQQLLQAYRIIKKRNIRVIVLMGGIDFWSNGIHLNCIEAAPCPADESLNNIEAINDIVREIILTEDQITISALRGNAGAGGVFMALACDHVWAREGIILNPHYKNIGNLFGSEYWTYLLPKRVGLDKAGEIMSNRLPIGTQEAIDAGLIDVTLSTTQETFREEITAQAKSLATGPAWEEKLKIKLARRAADETNKPLERYRKEELARMKLNFYGFDPSYHVARYNFVHKIPKSRTPLHLAIHRDR
ncbi:MAG: hydrogenase maturation protein [Candidatus Margulisiibacteriota bacterium]|nr:MAG: hydrogenase maturation protein [Candidatus Margulisbacteria bacterium GWD2_39_127]OGI03397.1 MAG: hydrogenase maturation protein [Candidatus Margulisbacteria bacterium GWF2_38_17]PZM81909.1 MAG: hydrogenase maturation protein [Candidatus Margulisiibacteriota bacterium]HAR64082.1 hydrogenase maturation protein [Candidatus Margulisiibacteriota bacterium]HCY37701.1 hydrogenase maturation protein [Candidatus Margulisiibacteriota bacterium]